MLRAGRAISTMGAAARPFLSPPHLRPLRVPPGGHTLSREYHIWHYSSQESIDNIKKTGQLRPGIGQKGTGVSLTTLAPGVASLYEIGTIVRNGNIPRSKIAAWLRIDTDTLDRLGIPWEKVSENHIFIQTSDDLDTQKLLSEYGETPDDHALVDFGDR